ncbi:unnamed protein product [Adineta ricciae]|uniref:Uncharacterized protein n=1 Tax=Adineta ricciae TaxID=249248 RepID=A0A815P7X3_ADIRI|nr:unnamed protein product [Adineta ricciae]
MPNVKNATVALNSETLSSKENIPLEQRIIFSSRHGYFVKNIDNIDQNFICQSCHLVFRQPFHLRCGHRQCQTCLNTQNNNIIHCILCSQSSTIDEIYYDEKFQNQLEYLLISCPVCDWKGQLKTYEKHLEDNHSNKLFTCAFCKEEVNQSKVWEHYLTSSHQLMVLNILCNLQRKHDENQKLKFSKILDSLNMTSNEITALDKSLQQIKCEDHLQHNTLQQYDSQILLLKFLSKNIENELNRMKTIQDFYPREIFLLKQQFNAKQLTVFDGILIWKINDVKQKLFVCSTCQGRGVAGTLLSMAKNNIQDVVAMGLASSHPYAVMAQCNACNRIPINLKFIADHAKDIIEICKIPYISRSQVIGSIFDKQSSQMVDIDEEPVSLIKTDFFVDHKEVLTILEKIQQTWILEPLLEGHEFVIILPTTSVRLSRTPLNTSSSNSSPLEKQPSM